MFGKQCFSVWTTAQYIMQGKFKRGTWYFQWILSLRLLDLLTSYIWWKCLVLLDVFSWEKDKFCRKTWLKNVAIHVMSCQPLETQERLLWFNQRQISGAGNPLNDTSEIILLDFELCIIFLYKSELSELWCVFLCFCITSSQYQWEFQIKTLYLFQQSGLWVFLIPLLIIQTHLRVKTSGLFERIYTNWMWKRRIPGCC